MFSSHTSGRWKNSLLENGDCDDGWTKCYVDPATGIEWLEYYPYPEDRSPPYMRHASIPEDPEVLLRTALTSASKDDWIGVAAYASGQLDTELTVRIFESLLDDISPAARKSFARSFRPDDNRNVVGMSYSEVTASYNRYLAACERMKSLK